MRKLFSLMVGAGVLSASFLAQADCRLDVPVLLNTDNLMIDANQTQKPIVLQNAQFDRAFRTEALENKDKPLMVEIFGVVYEKTMTSWVGTDVRADVTGLSGSAGFSWGYTGNFAMNGSKNQVNEFTTYVTTDTDPLYQMKPTDKELPKTELTLQMRGKELTSLQLTVPVYRVDERDHIKYFVYQGENETLCLKSAKLR